MNDMTGHNSELSEAERKALLIHHVEKIAAQDEICKAANAERKRLRNEAKTDGFKLSNIDFALKCREIEDPTIIPDDLREQAEIAAWFRLPVLFQSDMFEDRRPADERIYDEGYRAGMMRAECESGYEDSSKENGWWVNGWKQGQADQNANLAAAMEKRAEPVEEEDLSESLPQAAE